MLNMLIIEDNVLECQLLVNYISSSIPDIKLYSMTFNGAQALDIIKKEKIDVILMDLILPDVHGTKILNFIEENKLYNYKNSIIIISGEIYLYPELCRNQYVYDCLQKPFDFSKIINCLENIIEDKKVLNEKLIMEKKINIELHKLNYNFSYIGTQYLAECIYELYKKDDLSVNLSKDVYPIIAKRHSTSNNTVKCNIFQATLNSYYDCDQSKLEKYFGRYFYSKPKTKDVIFTVLKKLKESKK